MHDLNSHSHEHFHDHITAFDSMDQAIGEGNACLELALKNLKKGE